MLYISRILGHQLYGIMDTDDDVEEPHPWSSLNEAVLNYKLDIKGVETMELEYAQIITGVQPYQDLRYANRNCVKAKTLLGVDVVVFQDQVVYVYDSRGEGAVIRLSDYGSSVADYLEVDYKDSLTHKDKVTLVVDDKIKMRVVASLFGKPWVTWDFTDCTNDNFVRSAFSAVMDMSKRFQTSSLIDRKCRAGM